MTESANARYLPPLSNRGVTNSTPYPSLYGLFGTMTTLSARCDYYRATTQDATLIKWATEGYFNETDTQQSVPLYGYAHSLKHSQSGALYLFGGHTPTMGNCIQCGGSAVTALMDAENLPSVPALLHMGIEGWKVTRIDIAIDCFDAALRPRHVYAALDRKSMKTIFRSWREIAEKDLDMGHTVYGGGLESEKRIRIYDKAAESGTEGIWTRYEMVFSGNRAGEVWKMVCGCEDDTSLLAVALQLLRSVLEFPQWEDWKRVFGEAASVEWTPIPRVESDTWLWLMKQVAPTFRDAYDKDGDWRLLKRFIETLRNG